MCKHFSCVKSVHVEHFKNLQALCHNIQPKKLCGHKNCRQTNKPYSRKNKTKQTQSKTKQKTKQKQKNKTMWK